MSVDSLQSKKGKMEIYTDKIYLLNNVEKKWKYSSEIISINCVDKKIIKIQSHTQAKVCGYLIAMWAIFPYTHNKFTAIFNVLPSICSKQSEKKSQYHTPRPKLLINLQKHNVLFNFRANFSIFMSHSRKYAIEKERVSKFNILGLAA